MPERKGVVPAWQGLPPEAKVSITELRKTTYSNGLSVAILRYGWATRHRPDPTVEQLRRLLPALRSTANGNHLNGGGAWGDCATRGLVWDFLSQRGYTGYKAERDDRTEYQLKRFAKGLASINIWYAHKSVTTLVCDWPMPAGVGNQHSIDQRGWCVFERCLSSIVKRASCYLHMSRLPSGAENKAWWKVARLCKGNREPMITPDALEQMMREGIASGALKFTNGMGATNICVPQYHEAFARLLSKTTRLDYPKLGWGPDQGTQLAAAFEYAQRAGITAAAETLNLWDNSLGSEGIRAIGRVVERTRCRSSAGCTSKAIVMTASRRRGSRRWPTLHDVQLLHDVRGPRVSSCLCPPGSDSSTLSRLTCTAVRRPHSPNSSRPCMVFCRDDGVIIP
ncbi:unnamed protein product [Prorocentrum cordatum]|uniref:Uncharacterized protein n=1 Tax=Prorocentrum cordatum TaxID=2364126 RepID=A0ABN9VQW7_9DINO|nr:unnamed protein product [Polarella glacialis]